MTKKTEKTAPAEKREEKKKRGLLGRVVTLALVLCVVLAAAAMTAMEDGGRMASLRRWLIYGGSGGAKDVYTYAADSANRYGKLGKNLLVVKPNPAQLISDDGRCVSAKVQFILRRECGRCFYDDGGRTCHSTVDFFYYGYVSVDFADIVYCHASGCCRKGERCVE